MYQRKNTPQYSEWQRSNGNAPKDLVLYIVISCSGIKENVFFFFLLHALLINAERLKSGAFSGLFLCTVFNL